MNEKLDLKFTIVYSVHKSLEVLFDQVYDLDFYDLIDICKNKHIDGEKINGLDSSGICEFLIENNYIENDLIENDSLGIPKYIVDNPELFELTESDNNCDELGLNCNTILRKYFAILNIEQFIEFINNYDVCSTCDTMGILSYHGWLPAFSIQSNNYEIFEDLYVNVSYSKEIEEDEMINIENDIRTMIENGKLTEESVDELLTKFNE